MRVQFGGIKCVAGRPRILSNSDFVVVLFVFQMKRRVDGVSMAPVPIPQIDAEHVFVLEENKPKLHFMNIIHSTKSSKKNKVSLRLLTLTGRQSHYHILAAYSFIFARFYR